MFLIARGIFKSNTIFGIRTLSSIDLEISKMRGRQKIVFGYLRGTTGTKN
jgi:hypothetical protein